MVTRERSPFSNRSHLWPLLAAGAALLLLGAAVGCGSSKPSGLDHYTLQLSDLGPHFKEQTAHPVSNARAIKEGTSAAAVHRYGRVGGYDRDFQAKGFEPALVGITSRVVATRTAAGSHGAFLYSIGRLATTHPGGAKFHRVALPRIGAESHCYSFDETRKGARVYFCIWRQGRLIGELGAGGFLEQAGPALLRPFERILNKQASRMASFR